MEKTYYLLLLCAFSWPLQAQVLDENFRFKILTEYRPQFGPVLKQRDGKILVRCDCEFVGGIPVKGIVRLGVDLAFDPTFRANIVHTDSDISKMVLQEDNKILVALDSPTTSGLVRLNEDGSLDSSFDGWGFDRTIANVAVDRQGRILVIGLFDSFKGSSIKRIVRLTSQGDIDLTFNLDSRIESLNGPLDNADFYIQEDQKIVVVSSDLYSHLHPHSRLFRLNEDGTLDESFAYDGIIYSLDEQPLTVLPELSENKLLVFSRFLNPGSDRGNVRRINRDGSFDSTYPPLTLNVIPRIAYRQADGNVLAGGWGDGVQKIYADGSLDDSFFIEGSGPLRGITQTDDGNIILSSLDTVTASTENGLPGPTLNIPYQAPSLIFSASVKSYDEMLLGGLLGTVDDRQVKNVVALNTIENALSENFFYAFDHPVRTVKRFGDEFFSVDLKGKVQGFSSSGADTGALNIEDFDGNVFTIHPLRDGKKIIGGDFASYKGLSNTARLIKLHSDGTVDQGFSSPDVLTVVYSIEELSDGKILVNDFDPSVSLDTVRLLNTDGSVNTASPIKVGFSHAVTVIKASATQDIYIGGYFDSVDGIPSKGLTKISNGDIDVSFTESVPIDGHIYSIAVQRDDKVIVGGTFNYSGPEGVNGIARLNSDGSIDHSFPNLLRLPGDEVHTIEITNGDVYFGGHFVLPGTNYTSLVRLSGGLSRPEDLAVSSHYEGVDLTWEDKLSGETGYVIERAMEENGSYDVIAELSPNSTSYTDFNVLSHTSYSYRIKAVNNIGESHPSNLQTITTGTIVSVEAESFSRWNIYPNPTHGEILISYEDSFNGTIEVEVQDLVGASKMRRQFTKSGQLFSETLNLDGFAKGLYLIKVRASARTYTKRVVKL